MTATRPRGARRQRVAVVVVEWNSGDLLDRCLTALDRQTVRADRVIVVDNASTDAARHRSSRPERETEFVRLPTNRGFAAGNNHGIGLASDVEWIALLNPDAFPEPEWLRSLLAAADAHPEHSSFASRQIMADDPTLLDGTGDVYAVSGLAWRRDHGQAEAGRRTQPEEVFGPCAAAALYRRDALMEVGGFDESYFCYFEDVDLAFRLRLAGHGCMYVPDAVVRHVGSALSGRGSDFSIYHGHRNLVWTFWKNMPPVLLAIYWLHHLAVNLISITHFLSHGHGATILRAKRDALKAMPRILRARRVIQARRRARSSELRRFMVGGQRSLGRRMASTD